MEEINRDWKLGDVVKTYPSSVEIMLKYNIPCIGCNVPGHLTLDAISKEAGIGEKQLEEAIKKINKLLKENEPTTEELINLTKKAADKMSEIMQKDEKKGFGIKVAVLPGGCSGFSYGLDFQENQCENEETVESNGIKLFVEKEHLAFLKGLKIDYVDTLQGAGFKISNPNATTTCSCGQSFS